MKNRIKTPRSPEFSSKSHHFSPQKLDDTGHLRCWRRVLRLAQALEAPAAGEHRALLTEVVHQACPVVGTPPVVGWFNKKQRHIHR